MNTEQYLQMLEMQRMQGQPMQNMQQLPSQSMSQFSPIGAGASQAIDSVRQSMGYRPTQAPHQGLMGGLMSGLRNVAVGMVRGDPHPQVQAMGQGMRNTQEMEDIQNAENMRIMGFLQKASEAQKQQEQQQQQLEYQRAHQREQLAEQRRFHDMQSQHWKDSEGRMSASELKYAREMKKDLEKEQRYEELQKTDPGAQYTKDMSQADRTLAIKRQDKALDTLPYVKDSLHKIETLKKLVKDNPGVISSNWSRLKTDHNGNLTVKGAIFGGEKEKRVLSLFAKDINALKLSGAKGLGSKNTVFLDKIIAGSLPGVGMPDDAMLGVFDDMEAGNKGHYSSLKRVQSDKSRKIVNDYSFEHGGESSGAKIPSGSFSIKDNETGEETLFNGNEPRELIEEALKYGSIVSG
jgi:hypothetical protein